jgi:hypothetical protein
MHGFPAADDQATAVATQALVEFYQRLSDELDTAIGRGGQRVEYVPVENEIRRIRSWRAELLRLMRCCQRSAGRV